jgi:hypothetical protein
MIVSFRDDWLAISSSATFDRRESHLISKAAYSVKSR